MMIRMRKTITVILALLSATTACCHTARQPDTPNDTTRVRTERPKELPLPEVPDTLTAPEDRAAHIALHFWDTKDFADTTSLRDAGFMEQNFANFISILPYSTRQGIETAVKTLMTRAQSSKEAYRNISDMAEKYLYDPNSPMLNEELYITFLEEIIRSPLLDDTEKTKPAFALKAAKKNRLGTVAADFEYTDRHGRRRSLHGTKAETTVLVFYDPDCKHCTEIMKELKDDAALRKATQENRVTVLAIYSDGDRKLWDETKDSLPAEWLAGFDISDIQRRGTYILRAMPTIYILDSSKTVLAKDVMPTLIHAALSGNTAQQ